MSLEVKNTRVLANPNSLKLKVLIYGVSGVGKTSWCATAPNPGFAACETGNGAGLQTLADRSIDYVVPSTYPELEQFCSGHIFKDKETLVLDGFSYAADSILREYALAIPRQQGNSGKRAAGVLELDDYGVLAELERRLLAKILSLDKHIIITSLLDFYQPPVAGANPRAEKIGGPDLAGSMRLGAAAMVDVLLRFDMKPVLLDPKDPKSRAIQRVIIAEGTDRYLAKSRIKNGKTSLFPSETIFDLDKNIGTFDWFLSKALEGYKTTGAAG